MKNCIPKTNKFINGETVSYTLMAFFSVFLLISIKQLLKVFCGVPVTVSCIVGLVASSIVFYLLEKRFVFRKRALSSNLRQIIMVTVRTAVNFGFYKLAGFVFSNLLEMPESFVWTIAIASSFFFNYVFDRVLTFDCDYDAVEIRCSRIYRLFYSNRYVVSAGITALCVALIYIAYSVFPFGDYTVMRMDLYHQYGPLFAELYDRVVNHQSFLYSWTTGGGSSFLGNYLNYLSSPLSALIFLFDKEDISFAISFIVAVKCILSSATFTYYIKKSLNSSNFVSASFGTLYAFCAYFMAYYWNVMWLDGMILFPIILLGIEQIINKGTIKTYCISLALLMLSSYYMGFMACIFAVIYFIVYYSVSSSFNEKILANQVYDKKYTLKEMLNSKLINRGLRFAFGSILSACVCAVTLIPVFIILRGSSATSDTFPTTFTSYFDIFDFITSHFAAVDETIRSSGDDVLPNVYCGVLTIILIPLYVINDKIKLKEKAAYILILLFLLFSFDNNCLNFIWHAMHFPNDLPYRFSYMYSFILLVMAYKAIMNIKAVSVRDIGFVGMGWIFFVCTAQKMATTKMTEATVYCTIAFIILWTGFLMLIKKKKVKRLLMSVMLVAFVFCEVAVTDTGSFSISQPNEDYKTDYKTYTEAIDYIKDNDKGFYKTELCYLERRMDPSYYGYEGMSVFSSMAYEAYSGTQYSLGMFGNRINSYTYNTQTPIYNLMFNIKYLIQTDVSLPPSNNLYKKIYTTTDEKANVYENKYHLPIAYCVSENIDNWIVEEGNPFTAQGDFFELATGYSDVFKSLDYISCEFDGLEGDEVTDNGTYWFSKNDSESTYGNADITMTSNIDGNVYIYVTSPDVKTIEVNSDRVASHVQNIEEPYILDIGYHEKGDEIKVTVDGGSSETADSYFEIYAYSVDDNVLKKGYNKLLSGAVNVTSHSDTKIEATVSCDENSYLYSSIPYDDSWKVYIDGVEAETFELGDSMLAVQIKSGEHQITYKYSPKGFTLGAFISSATVVGIAGYIVYENYFSKIAKTKRRKKQ